MKKYIHHVSIVAAATAVFSFSGAQAGFMTFSDDDLAFSGYDSSVYTQDEYGTPKIDSISVKWSDSTGNLENVTINLHTSTHRQKFDNLFINNDFGSVDSNEQGWDYLVHDGGQNRAWANSGTTPGNGLWQVDENYTYTYNTWGGRVGHPTGIDAGSLSNWSAGPGINHSGFNISYDFNGLGIHVGNGFALAYSPWCANDVIIGSYSMDPVPEPATMVLFGLGLIGFIGSSVYKKKLAKEKADKSENTKK